MQFIDLGAQRERLGGRISAVVEKVIAEGRYILGPEVTEFENRMADYMGVGHVVACANGTDALVIPLMAYGIGPGDAVFCPSFTFAATAEVVALVGAEPVFIDVDPDTYNIVPAQLETAIAEVKKEGRLKTKAIIPVDLFGLAADYAAIAEIAAREGLVVIEDAAQATGGTQGGVKCGAFGNVGSTSFYPAKPLGCYGDGGAIFTNDADLTGIMRSVAFHGKGASQYDNVRIGLNSRLDTIQAAILIEKLSILEEEMEMRQEVARRYCEGLGNLVKVPVVPEGNRSAWAQFAIETGHRDAVRQALKENGIPTMVYYEKPLHQQKAYSRYKRASGGLPVSETLPDRILCLPMHPYLKTDDQERIVDVIRGAVEANA
ncbi:MAG: DegT/DnrJ/EryC1/StrS aminotransferase family protein [Rhizobiaceae bacterium]|nr:MAG: DegT/DnrJ/EryC1/StrS aminotransferase family protein [Rhizobiaceae bacterium]